MFATRRTVRIEWGDCDPAGIVFYPRYFAMFDHSTVLLIEQALGMQKHALYQHYGFGGYPSVGMQARFLIPTRYGDDIEIETAITKVGRSSFSLQHKLAPQRRAGGRGQRDPRLGGARPRPARRLPRATDARRSGRTPDRYCAALRPIRFAIAASVSRWESSDAANSLPVPGMIT